MKPKAYGEVTTYKMSQQEIEKRYGTWGDKSQENGVKMTIQDSGRPRTKKSRIASYGRNWRLVARLGISPVITK